MTLCDPILYISKKDVFIVDAVEMEWFGLRYNQDIGNLSRLFDKIQAFLNNVKRDKPCKICNLSLALK